MVVQQSSADDIVRYWQEILSNLQRVLVYPQSVLLCCEYHVIFRFSESRALMRIQAVAHDETSKVAADEQFAASGWTSSKLVFVVSSTRGHRVAESFAGK